MYVRCGTQCPTLAYPISSTRAIPLHSASQLHSKYNYRVPNETIH
jgi:hypothetical protein